MVLQKKKISRLASELAVDDWMLFYWRKSCGLLKEIAWSNKVQLTFNDILIIEQGMSSQLFFLSALVIFNICRRMTMRRRKRRLRTTRRQTVKMKGKMKLRMKKKKK